VLEVFFEVLLALVCVGVLAFAGLTVKKLYQGQR
jgi:Tfp pilus assembly protein PilV